MNKKTYFHIYYKKNKEEIRIKQKIRYDNLTPEQIESKKIYNQKYYQKHRLKIKLKKYQREYYKLNCEKLKKYQRERYRTKYGLIDKTPIPKPKPLKTKIVHKHIFLDLS